MAAGLRNIKIKLSGEADMSKAVGQVEGSLKGVDRAGRKAGAGLDKAGEAADAMDTRAMGFRDTMTGVQDTMLGVGQIARGNLFEGFLTLGMGIGDLGSGIFNFLVPAFKALTLTSIKAKAAAVSHKVALVATTVATKAMAVAQRVLNAVMRANPIGIIITLIAALVAGIIWAWKNNETFRKIVTAVWKAIHAAIKAVVNWLVNTAWPFIKRVWDNIVAGVTRVKDRVVNDFNWIRSKIGAAISGIKGFLSGMWDGIVSGAKAAINTAIRFVNGAIRGINKVTGAVGIPPIPEIRQLAKGGVVTRPTFALIGEAGPEAVVPLDKLGDIGGRSGDTHVYVTIDGQQLEGRISRVIRETHRGLRRAVTA